MDACSLLNVDAAESSITFNVDRVARDTIYGDRGQLNFTVAGQNADQQANHRDVVLDLNIEGTLDPLDPAIINVHLIDNLRNCDVSTPSSYSGFETEFYPANTSFVVAAIPHTGYQFDSSVTVTVAIDDSSTGPNKDLFDSDDITLDYDTVQGQMLVVSTPEAMQVLAGGTTDIYLRITALGPREPEFGPPGAAEFSRGAIFKLVTDQGGEVGLPNHTVDPAAQFQIEFFNTADQNSENNLEYQVTITPPINETYDGNLPTIAQLSVFSDDGVTDFNDADYSVSNIRLGDDSRSVVFDFEFTYSQVPSLSIDPIEVWFDLPDIRTTNEKVSVVFELAETIDNVEISSASTMTFNGQGAGDEIVAVFTLKPDQFFTIDQANSITKDVTKPADIDTLPTVQVNYETTSGQRGQSLSVRARYTITSDDVTNYSDGDPLDRTIRFRIDLSGEIASRLTSTLRIIAEDYSGTTLTASPNPMDVPVECVLNVDAFTYSPSWVIPTNNTLHWYKTGSPMDNIVNFTFVSGSNYVVLNCSHRKCYF